MKSINHPKNLLFSRRVLLLLAAVLLSTFTACNKMSSNKVSNSTLKNKSTFWSWRHCFGSPRTKGKTRGNISTSNQVQTPSLLPKPNGRTVHF